MHTLRRPCLAAMIAAAAQAQTTLSLDQSLNEATTRHPMITIAESRIAAARGLSRQAALTFNPKLVLQHENARPYAGTGQVFWRDTDSFAYLQQTFERGGKRDRRVEASRAVIARAEAHRDVERQQIAGRVRSAYWSMAGAEAAVLTIEGSRANFQRIIDYHETRVKEGAMAEADLLRVRLEGDRIDVALNAARLSVERAAIVLQREIGRGVFEPIRTSGGIDALPVAADAARAVDQRAEVRFARAEADVARFAVGVQRSVATPNVEALFGFKRTAGYSSMIGGVQIDLLFRNRNEGNIDAAAAEVRAAEAGVAAAEAIVKAEVAAAQREVEIRTRLLRLTIEPMLTQARRASDIARAAYREGGADLLRLLDAERIRLETEQLHVQTLAELRQSVAALETAMGALP